MGTRVPQLGTALVLSAAHFPGKAIRLPVVSMMREGEIQSFSEYPAASIASRTEFLSSAVVDATFAVASWSDTSTDWTPGTLRSASVTWRAQLLHDIPPTCRTVSVMRRTLVLLMSVVLVGCGGASVQSAGEVPDGAEFNEADLEFLAGMIPHHEQAIVMAEMVSSVEVSVEVAKLADEVRMSQTPEITVMRSLISDWGLQIDTHSGHDSGEHSDHGMMSPEDLDTLADSAGADFERRWLTMMIEHHEGALAMAREVLTTGKAPAVRELATSIVALQTAEIGQMQRLLDGF